MAYILIIDDDDDFTAAASMALQSTGHEVEIEHAPAAGLEAIERRKPDLAVVDVMFPEDSAAGFKIVQSEQLKGIPVLMLTAVNARFPLGFSEDDIDDTWLPVKDFLEKPVDLDTLQARVAALLGKAADE